MKKVQLIFILLFLTLHLLIAEEYVTLTDGRQLLLRSDGTYEFIIDEYTYSVSHDGKLIKTEIATGAEIWSFSGHGSWVADVCGDSAGNIYTAGGDNQVRKFDGSNGTVIWSYRNSHPLNALASDANGNIYTGGSDNKITKLSPEGKNEWKTGVNGVVSTITVDQTGDIYAGTLNGTIYRIDTEGDIIWSYQTTHILGVTVDSSDSVYAVGGKGNGVIKLSSSGEELWRYSDNTATTITNVVLDSLGYIYLADSDGKVSKLNPSSGDFISEISGINDTLFGLAVDNNGLIYVGTKRGNVCCLDINTGKILWCREIHTAHVREIVLSGNIVMQPASITSSTAANQQEQQNQQSDADAEETEIIYEVGDVGPSGGIITYKNTDSDGEWQYLEIAPAGWAGTEKDPKFHWGGKGIVNKDIRGEEVGSGYFNTNRIIEVLSSVESEIYAAEYCDNFVYGGFSDWYLPSRDELYMLYINLFQKGLGGLESSSYLSSTEYSANNARTFSMNDGKNHLASKTAEVYVRPVRRF